MTPANTPGDGEMGELAADELLAPLYRALIEHLPLVVYIDLANEPSSAVYISPQIESLLGYSVEEWLEDPEFFIKRLHPDDRERVRGKMREAILRREAYSDEYRLVGRDGRIVWFLDESVYVPDENLTPGYLVDITARKCAEEALRRQNEELAALHEALEQELSERVHAEEALQDVVARLRQSQLDLTIAHEEMIRRLSYAAEFRDTETGRHVERMGLYCATLAKKLGLAEQRCELIRVASALHDIGKIGVPEGVLLKPGQLETGDRRLVDRHAEIGHAILSGSGSSLLELAATIAWTHHEWFNGNGYPRGLAGDAIPLEGRIASVADVFDALTSDRPYRPAFSVPEALAIMRDGRGTQFDPLVLDLFLDSVAELVLAGPDPGAALRPDPDPALQETSPLHFEAEKSQPPRIEPDHLRIVFERAHAALASAEDDRRAIDAALDEMVEAGGGKLLPSVVVRDQDRLWLFSQRGYDQVLDGLLLTRGVVGKAVRTGEAQLQVDVTQSEDYVGSMPGVRSELAIPLGRERPAVGAFNLEVLDSQLPACAPELAEGFAQSLGTRLAGVRGRLGSDLASLARLFVDASSLRTVDAVAEFATRTLGRLLELESAQMNLSGVAAPYALASFWRQSKSLQPLSAAEIARIAASAALHDTALGVVDPGVLGLRDPTAGRPRRVIWLPLRVGGDEIGALVGSGSFELSLRQEQVEAATLVAQYAAALIDGAQALDREQRAAGTDPLTGLLNRRGFDKRFQEELQRAERGGRELAVVVFDCDDLKAMNDRGGHELGDAVLLRIGRLLRSAKRLQDAAARLGGDEFALLLPEIGAARAVAAAERLREVLAEPTDAEGHPVTATFGVAAYPHDGRTPADLIRAADRAMYAGKRSGKNRTLALGAALPSSD